MFFTRIELKNSQQSIENNLTWSDHHGSAIVFLSPHSEHAKIKIDRTMKTNLSFIISIFFINSHWCLL